MSEKPLDAFDSPDLNPEGFLSFLDDPGDLGPQALTEEDIWKCWQAMYASIGEVYSIEQLKSRRRPFFPKARGGDEP